MDDEEARPTQPSTAAPETPSQAGAPVDSVAAPAGRGKGGVAEMGAGGDSPGHVAADPGASAATANSFLFIGSDISTEGREYEPRGNARPAPAPAAPLLTAVAGPVGPATTVVGGSVGQRAPAEAEAARAARSTTTEAGLTAEPAAAVHADRAGTGVGTPEVESAAVVAEEAQAEVVVGTVAAASRDGLHAPVAAAAAAEAVAAVAAAEAAAAGPAIEAAAAMTAPTAAAAVAAAVAAAEAAAGASVGTPASAAAAAVAAAAEAPLALAARQSGAPCLVGLTADGRDVVVMRLLATGHMRAGFHPRAGVVAYAVYGDAFPAALEGRLPRAVYDDIRRRLNHASFQAKGNNVLRPCQSATVCLCALNPLAWCFMCPLLAQRIARTAEIWEEAVDVINDMYANEYGVSVRVRAGMYLQVVGGASSYPANSRTPAAAPAPAPVAQPQAQAQAAVPAPAATGAGVLGLPPAAAAGSISSMQDDSAVAPQHQPPPSRDAPGQARQPQDGPHGGRQRRRQGARQVVEQQVEQQQPQPPHPLADPVVAVAAAAAPTAMLSPPPPVVMSPPARSYTQPLSTTADNHLHRNRQRSWTSGPRGPTPLHPLHPLLLPPLPPPPPPPLPPPLSQHPLHSAPAMTPPQQQHLGSLPDPHQQQTQQVRRQQQQTQQTQQAQRAQLPDLASSSPRPQLQWRMLPPSPPPPPPPVAGLPMLLPRPPHPQTPLTANGRLTNRQRHLHYHHLQQQALRQQQQQHYQHQQEQQQQLVLAAARGGPGAAVAGPVLAVAAAGVAAAPGGAAPVLRPPLWVAMEGSAAAQRPRPLPVPGVLLYRGSTADGRLRWSLPLLPVMSATLLAPSSSSSSSGSSSGSSSSAFRLFPDDYSVALKGRLPRHVYEHIRVQLNSAVQGLALPPRVGFADGWLWRPLMLCFGNPCRMLRMRMALEAAANRLNRQYGNGGGGGGGGGSSGDGGSTGGGGGTGRGGGGGSGGAVRPSSPMQLPAAQGQQGERESADQEQEQEQVGREEREERETAMRLDLRLRLHEPRGPSLRMELEFTSDR